MEMRRPNYLIRYSDDDAETFTEFPFGGTDGNLRLQAVDPSNPDRVIAVLDRAGQGRRRARRARTAARHSSSTCRCRSSARSRSRLRARSSWARRASRPCRSRQEGLWVADSLAEEPTKIGDYPAQCLAYQESTDTLFACQYRTFGTVDQASGEFTRAVQLQRREGLRRLRRGDTAASCERAAVQGLLRRRPLRDGAGLRRLQRARDMLCGPCAAMVDNGADIAACLSGGGGGGGSSAAARRRGGRAPAARAAPAGAGPSRRAHRRRRHSRRNGRHARGGDDDGDGDDDGGAAAATRGRERRRAAAGLRWRDAGVGASAAKATVRRSALSRYAAARALLAQDQPSVRQAHLLRERGESAAKPIAPSGAAPLLA